MNICIFCSANYHIPAEYFQATKAFGQWCARQGHTIIFGGTNQGLMECVAEAAFNAGGHVIGVIPEIVERGGRTSEYVHTRILTTDLNDRKAVMIDRADAIVALPGGVGTLDEVFTVLAAASIGYHHKQVILFNPDGFWQKLIELFDDLDGHCMIRGRWQSQLLVANTIDEVQTLIETIHTEPGGNEIQVDELRA